MHVRAMDVEGFERVLRIQLGDDPGDGVAFLAIHALVAGRSFGGIRIRPYPDEAAALADVLALARAMTRKVLLAGLPGGGAKSVVCLPVGDRAAAIARLGEVIEELGGQTWCGPDLGFTADDDRVLRGVTRYVARGGLARFTARSVRLAMEAALGGPPAIAAVQGIGAAGKPLAEMLAADGARIVFADPVVPDQGLDPAWERVPPEALYDVACDAFAPCAAGEVLDVAAVDRLRCRVVCGAANNPVAGPDADARLAARGIVFVPDILANCGATIAGVCEALGGGHEIEARLAAIPERVLEILATSRAEGRTPSEVATALADRALEAARRER